MSYILVKAPPREGDIPPEVLFRRTKEYAKMTPKKRAEYEERVRVNNERKERLATHERARRGTPDIDPDFRSKLSQEKQGLEESEGTSISRVHSAADERTFQPSEAYIPPSGKYEGPRKLVEEPERYEEDETMQLTPTAKLIRQRLMESALAAAQEDTTGRRKKTGVVGELDLGDTRYQQTKRAVTEEGEKRGLSGDELEEYVRGKMKTTYSDRGAATGRTSQKLSGRWVGEGKDRKWTTEQPTDAEQLELEAQGRHRPARIERSTNINLAIDRKNREDLRRRTERMGLQARERASQAKETSFDPPSLRNDAGQMIETPHVQHLEAKGRSGADIPEPSSDHAQMFGSTKKNIKYHSSLKEVMQRLLGDDPDKVAEMLDMPHLAEYAKKLDDDENLELKTKGGEEGVQEGEFNDRGKHLLNILGEQMMRRLGGGGHHAVLEQLGLTMAPGHDTLMGGQSMDGGPAEIDAHMGTFDKEIQDASLPLTQANLTHERYGRAQGVPEDAMEDFTAEINDLMETGHTAQQARDRALMGMMEDGIISETALQSGEEGEQDYGGKPIFRPSGTLETTRGPKMHEGGEMTADEYESQVHRWEHPVTGKEQWDEEPPDAAWPKPSKRFTQSEDERVREEARSAEKRREIAARRAGTKEVAEAESDAMSPDAYANITAGMTEDEKQLFYQSMGMEAPGDERTAADITDSEEIEEPQTESAMRQARRVVGPARGDPRTRPLPFTGQEAWGEDDDDEVSTMAVSGFSLGSQLLKAILDDMLK